MQKQTNDISPLEALKIARQVRAIKRAVLHNVEYGINDMPAKGLVNPFAKPELHPKALPELNKALEAYDVKVDAYKMRVKKDTYIDRIMVTHLDNNPVKPSPAYQAALQTRLTAMV